MSSRWSMAFLESVMAAAASTAAAAAACTATTVEPPPAVPPTLPRASSTELAEIGGGFAASSFSSEPTSVHDQRSLDIGEHPRKNMSMLVQTYFLGGTAAAAAGAAQAARGTLTAASTWALAVPGACTLGSRFTSAAREKPLPRCHRCFGSGFLDSFVKKKGHLAMYPLSSQFVASSLPTN